MGLRLNFPMPRAQTRRVSDEVLRNIEAIREGRGFPEQPPLTGGVLLCDGNCHKPVEQGGAKPCDCPCCRRYG